MKHIIIAGAGRSGKTTISIDLRNKGYTHYKMDSIKRGLDNNFYPNKITNWHIASPKISHLIKTIIEETNTDIIKNIEYYVIDTCHLYPKDIIKENINNTIIIFLGYPHITPEEKLAKIRTYDKENQWTNNISNDQLLKDIKQNIEYSKEIEKECQRLNIPFFDTGTNYQKTIEKIIKYLEEHI